jgi:hypothetical protein
MSWRGGIAERTTPILNDPYFLVAMKRNTILIGICLSGLSHLVVFADDGVEQALLRVGYAQENAKNEAAKLQSRLPLNELLPQLMDAFVNPKDHKFHAGANFVILALDPFPFDEMLSQLKVEENAYRKTGLLWFLGQRARTEEQKAQLIAQAKGMIYDQRPGMHIHGPASEYGTTRLRVCDEAYHVLRRHLKMESEMEDLHSTDIQYPSRNKQINKLLAAIGLPAPKWQEYKPPEGVPAVLNQTKGTNPSLERKQSTQQEASSNDDPTSSTRWSLIVTLIVAASGLLWLLIKNRCQTVVRVGK